MRNVGATRGSLVFLVLAATVIGCSAAPGDIPVPAETLREDSAYMKSLFKQRGGTEGLKIDLGDDRQYLFVLNRLQASGIVPEMAPRLYAGLTEARDRALAIKAGKIPASTSLLTADRCNIFVVQSDLTTSAFDSLARGSCVDGSIYSYVDQYQYNENTDVLAYDYKEEWNQGIATDVTLSGTPSAQQGVWADAFAYKETSTTTEMYYYATSLYSNHLESGGLPQLAPDFSEAHAIKEQSSPPTNDLDGTKLAPSDLTGDNKIILCLERNTSSADCDYKHTNTGTCGGNDLCKQNAPYYPIEPIPYNTQKLYMPIEGYSIPVATHDAANPWVIEYAKAWLTMRSPGTGTPAGGFCERDLTGTPKIKTELVPIGPSTKVKIVIDPFAPELGNASWPDHCIDHGKAVDLDVEVKLRKQNCDPSITACIGPAVTWTTRATTSIPDPPPMYVYWGCLPTGTEITLANGARATIENIGAGQQVMADDRGRMLTVIDVVEGIERKPLVRVVDDRGNTVNMTTTHAVPMANDVVVQAQELMIGDRILTQNGPATVVAVERLAYESAVYNLVLGTPDELQVMGPHETTMYANGIRVGDSRMQGAIVQARRDEAAQAKAMQALPAEFERDHRLWLLREQKRAAQR